MADMAAVDRKIRDTPVAGGGAAYQPVACVAGLFYCIVMEMLVDALNRPIKDLRISVTDRCNFRCTYCMPLDEYDWIHKKEILTFEEISRLATLFVQFGVEKIR